MPSGLQKPKKGGFEISLATDLWLSFSTLKAGVKEVRGLLNQDQTFLSYNAFIAKFNIKTKYLEYFSKVIARNSRKYAHLPLITHLQIRDTASLLSHSNIDIEYHKRLVQNKASIPLESQVKWLSENDIIGNSTVNWRNAHYLPFLCTTETKLRVLQFRFLHRRTATKDFLCKIGIKQVDSCSLISAGKLLKLWSTCFGSANIPKPSGKKLLEWMHQKIVNLKDSSFSPFLCLGLVENVSNVLPHHLLLIARHYCTYIPVDYSTPYLICKYIYNFC